VRILVTTPSAWGHLQPMMPLVQALQHRGHELRWATGADSCRTLEMAGVSTIAAGVDQQTLLTPLSQLPPSVRELPREAVPNVMFGHIFGRIAAPAMLRDLSPVVARWAPDLVIHDAAEFAGPIIAASLGVPSVTKSFGMLLPRERVIGAGQQVAGLWRSMGLDPPTFGGCYRDLYLDICPGSLQPSLPNYLGRRQELRPLSHDRTWSDPHTAELSWPPGFPEVYLTLGTVFPSASVLGGIVAAVAELGAGMLVTVGPRMDPADLGRQPPHVRVERYVPQSLVLTRCRVVVSHGGSGTAFAALSNGVPQLLLPQGADQFLNANAIARAGAGLQLRTDTVDAEAIASAVRRLLTEPGFSSASAQLAGEISRMPGPDQVAEVLEGLPG
jgi:UDP:flavonoid glycosyltransferase YjiC (YdhE family)